MRPCQLLPAEHLGERAKRASLEEDENTRYESIPRNGYRHNGYIHY